MDLLTHLQERMGVHGSFGSLACIQRTFGQVVAAIAFLHDHGIAHLDISLENVLVVAVEPHIQISVCDFGMARSTASPLSAVRLQPGKPGYRAPEVASFSILSSFQRRNAGIQR